MTFPSFSVGEVLTASDMNAVGMWKLSSFTVSSAGGTGATVSNGVVSIGSGNTSVTLSSVFSSTYDNYLIVGQQITTSAGNNFRLNLNPWTGNEYYNGAGTMNYTGTAGSAVASNLAYWNMPGGDGGPGNSFQWTVYGPNTTTARKSLTGLGHGNAQGYYVGGQLIAGGAQTGFTITVSTGSFSSGTLRVYGIRN